MDLVTTWGVCGFTASTACSELHKILFPVPVAPSQGFPNIPEVAQETEELSVCPLSSSNWMESWKCSQASSWE